MVTETVEGLDLKTIGQTPEPPPNPEKDPNNFLKQIAGYIDRGEVFEIKLLRSDQDPSRVDSVVFYGCHQRSGDRRELEYKARPEKLVEYFGWDGIKNLNGNSTADEWKAGFEGATTPNGTTLKDIQVTTVIKRTDKSTTHSHRSREIRATPEAIQVRGYREDLQNVLDGHFMSPIIIQLTSKADQRYATISYGRDGQSIEMPERALAVGLGMGANRFSEMDPQDLALLLRASHKGPLALDVRLRGVDGKLVNGHCRKTGLRARVSAPQSARELPSKPVNPTKRNPISTPEDRLGYEQYAFMMDTDISGSDPQPDKRPFFMDDSQLHREVTKLEARYRDFYLKEYGRQPSHIPEWVYQTDEYGQEMLSRIDQSEDREDLAFDGEEPVRLNKNTPRQGERWAKANLDPKGKFRWKRDKAGNRYQDQVMRQDRHDVYSEMSNYDAKIPGRMTDEKGRVIRLGGSSLQRYIPKRNSREDRLAGHNSMMQALSKDKEPKNQQIQPYGGNHNEGSKYLHHLDQAIRPGMRRSPSQYRPMEWQDFQSSTPVDHTSQEAKLERTLLIGKQIDQQKVDLLQWPEPHTPEPDWWEDTDDTTKRAYSIIRHIGRNPLQWQGSGHAPYWFTSAPEWKKPLLNILAEKEFLTSAKLPEKPELEQAVAAFIDRRTDKPRFPRSKNRYLPTSRRANNAK